MRLLRGINAPIANDVNLPPRPPEPLKFRICLMLHDGEKGKLDLAVGLSQSGGSDMCDYSLHNVRSRPAKVGDKLTTRDFGTGTRGFAASQHASLPVCVLPRTKLSLHSFAQ